MQVNAVFHHTLPSEKRKFLITGPRHANKKDGALWNLFPATKTKRDRDNVRKNESRSGARIRQTSEH